MESRNFFIFVAALAAASSGCTSTTQIVSRPAGAAVVMDGSKHLGKTPIQLTEPVWLWTKHSLTLEKPGYQPATMLIRNDGLHFGYAAICVCTGGLLLPLAFVSSYQPRYEVTLDPVATSYNGVEFRARPNVEFQ